MRQHELLAEIARLKAEVEEWRKVHRDDLFRAIAAEAREARLAYEAEEAECAHMVLDDWGVPREDNGNRYSLVGRITVAREAREAKARATLTEGEAEQRRRERIVQSAANRFAKGGSFDR
jgi:hypothetical protein